MRNIIGIVILFVVALLALVIGASLIVLLAFGVGMIVTRMLPLSTFEATLLAVIALLPLLALLWHAALAIAHTSVPGDETFEDEDDDEEEEMEDEEPEFIPSIPRWRRPTKISTAAQIRPNDLCPCGSGKKYKNCHGKRTTQRT